MNALSFRLLGRWGVGLSLALPLLVFGDEAKPNNDVQRLDSIVVSGQRIDPEQKPYRDLMASVTMFTPYQQKHPNAQLRFRLYARKPGFDMSKLSVAVHNLETGKRWPITLADDGSFTLPEVPVSDRAVAVVRTNVPWGLLAWVPRIVRNDAGVGRRLLGDIREECRLDLDGSRITRSIVTPAVMALRAMGDLCMNRSIYWIDYAEQTLFAVHIKHQGRELHLQSSDLYGGATPSVFHPGLDWPYLLRDRAYRPPIWDASWPDDAEVKLVYVNEDPERVSKQ